MRRPRPRSYTLEIRLAPHLNKLILVGWRRARQAHFPLGLVDHHVEKRVGYAMPIL